MEYPLFLEHREIGTVREKTEGDRIQWTASCPVEEGWIYRVYLGTEAAPKGVYLGIMMPEGKRFVLRKSLHRNRCLDTADRGIIVRYRPGEAEPQIPSKPESESEQKLLPFALSMLGPVPNEDSFVHSTFRACGGKYAEWEGNHYFLAPGRPGESLGGAAAFFCLLRWIPWEESGWWVLCTDGEGQPFVLPEQTFSAPEEAYTEKRR